MATEKELARLVVKMEADNERLRSDIDKASRTVKRFERDTKKSLNNVNSAFKKFAGILVSAGIGRALVQTIRTTEVLKASLETVTGSSEAAGDAFKELQGFAAKTPFSLQEVTQSFIRLKALGLEPTTELLTSFGNTASAFGTSLMQYSEAVADAITGEFERLKEFGIKASSQGEQVAFTFRGTTKVVKKNADEIKAYLTEIGDNDFAGAMARRAETLDGSISNMLDSIEQLLVAVGDLGLTAVINTLAQSVSRLAEFLKNGADDMQRLARAISIINGPISRLNSLYELRAKLEQKLDDLASKRGGELTSEFERYSVLLDQTEREIREIKELIDATNLEPGDFQQPQQKLPPIKIGGGKVEQNYISPQELKRLEKLAQKLQQPFDKLQTELKDLDTLLERGMISWDEYSEAVFNALEGVEEPLADTKDSFEDLKRAIEGWGQSFADTLLDAEGSMEDFADTIIKQLARIAITRLMDPVFSMFGDFVGSSLSSAFGGFRAAGGPVSAGKGYVVGERGPELFIPSTPGTVMPNGAIGGPSISIGNIDARGSQNPLETENAVYRAVRLAVNESVATMRDLKSRGALPEFT